MKGGIGEILHVEIKAANVGPSEGGSESATPAWSKQTVAGSVSAEARPALIIHGVCVCGSACVCVSPCAQTHMCDYAWPGAPLA